MQRRADCIQGNPHVTKQIDDILRSCETEFKISCSNHKQSFKFENKKHATELSKAVWNAKDGRETPLIEWSIVKRVPPYQCGSKICQKCSSYKQTRKTC